MINTRIIVFSKERPLQLYSYLESLLLFSDAVEQQIYVIYVYDENFSYNKVIKKFPEVNWIPEINFFKTLKDILICPEEYILFGCDDVIFTKKFSIYFAESVLSSKENIFGFSFRLGKNIRPLPSFIYEKDYLIWNWQEAPSGHYSYPWELCCTLYRKIDVINIIKRFKTFIKSPNFFENAFYSDAIDINSKNYIASYVNGVAIVLTINRVQDDFMNPVDASIGFESLYLSKIFSEQDERIDVLTLNKCINSMVHVDGRYFILKSLSNYKKIKRIISINAKEYMRILFKKYNYLNRYKLFLKNIFIKLKKIYNNFFLKVLDLFKITIYSPIETVDSLVSSPKSLSRFGDGEFAIMAGNSIPFQKADAVLAKRLKQILLSKQKNIAVAIPYCMLYDYNLQYKFVRNFFSHWKCENKKNICKIKMCGLKNKYYATEISQMFEVYINYNFNEFYLKMRKIWHNREVLLVTNKNVLANLEINIFDNAEKISIIDAPAKDAFDVYQDIMNKITVYPKNTICLISLGPTATVLAYDLCLRGYRALDIGHIWKDYAYFMREEAHTTESIKKFCEPD